MYRFQYVQRQWIDLYLLWVSNPRRGRGGEGFVHLSLSCYQRSLSLRQGGASVAFPVMTLAFGISPHVARDFSFMIQSAGMTAAAVTIFLMKVHVETHAIVYATIGGVCGLVLGLEQVGRSLRPPL